MGLINKKNTDILKIRHSYNKRKISVTVCIAAICEQYLIFGAADKMVTTEDVEFEPFQTKIYPITNSIRIMTAGDSTFQYEIYLDVANEVITRIKRDSKDWWRIKDVADLYAKYYHSAKLKRAESFILSPLGLTKETFITGQQQMKDSFLQNLTKEMFNFEAPDVATIITGYDNTGAHIYTVRNGEIDCLDAIGFASIGSGSRHANSQFMFARHSPRSPFEETLLLVYTAKKRAEVAPGVGKDTDMFAIAQGLGSAMKLEDNLVTDLESIYRNIADKEGKAQEEGKITIRKYVKEITKAKAKKKQKPEDKSETDGK